MDHSSISILIAVKNEEAGIGPTLSELNNSFKNSHCLIVDGNSNDKTAFIAQKLGAHVIYQKGQGKGNAISEGLKHINDKTKYLVFTDGDFTYPTKCLFSMIKIMEYNPKIGMVIGNRFNRMLSPRAMKNPYYIGNRILAIAQYVLNGIKLSDPLSGLRVTRWEILKNWVPKSKGFDIEVELNHRVECLGYDIQEIPISYRARMGEKKLKLRHGFLILKRIIAESLSQHDLA